LASPLIVDDTCAVSPIAGRGGRRGELRRIEF
jgi:hypothetical protein